MSCIILLETWQGRGYINCWVPWGVTIYLGYGEQHYPWLLWSDPVHYNNLSRCSDHLLIFHSATYDLVMSFVRCTLVLRWREMLTSDGSQSLITLILACLLLDLFIIYESFHILSNLLHFPSPKNNNYFPRRTWRVVQDPNALKKRGMLVTVWLLDCQTVSPFSACNIIFVFLTSMHSMTRL